MRVGIGIGAKVRKGTGKVRVEWEGWNRYDIGTRYALGWNAGVHRSGLTYGLTLDP